MKNKLNGLVLAGGKSTRMGTDKGALVYKNEPHRLFMYKLLSQFCDNVFMSVRADQLQELPKGINYIVDTNTVKGPFNGILSAFEQDNSTGWLVVATDLPFVDAHLLKQLLEERDTNYIATAFAGNESKLPEPLIAIWEPEAYEEVQGFIKHTGKTCPRKFLINTNTKYVFPKEDFYLTNANVPEDYEQAIKQLKIK